MEATEQLTAPDYLNVDENNDDPYAAPLYLQPSVYATPNPTRISWRSCVTACAFVAIFAFYGLTCGLAGYRLQTCDNALQNSTNDPIFNNTLA